MNTSFESLSRLSIGSSGAPRGALTRVDAVLTLSDFGHDALCCRGVRPLSNLQRHGCRDRSHAREGARTQRDSAWTAQPRADPRPARCAIVQKLIGFKD